MKKKYLEDSTEDYSYVDQVVRSLYGCSDEQLLKELEEAEQNSPPVDFEIYPDEFDRIWEDIQEERRENQEKKTGKVRRFTWKRAVAIAAAACLMVGSTCLVAWGTKTYFYRERSRGGVKGDVVFNNDMAIKDVANVEAAYLKIQKELGIEPLKIGYMPSDLRFTELKIGNDYAIIEFDCDEKKFYMIYKIGLTESSMNYQSDGNTYRTIENKWIGRTIKIRKENIETENVRFEANIVNDSNIYICLGNINESDYVKIVENLFY